MLSDYLLPYSIVTYVIPLLPAVVQSTMHASKFTVIPLHVPSISNHAMKIVLQCYSLHMHVVDLF